jgi:hypothetical protein
MKKTLQECKEIVAREEGYNNWEGMILDNMRPVNVTYTDLANKMYYEQSEWISVEDRGICKEALIDILDKINSNPSLPLLQDIREIAKKALQTNFIITP